MNWLDLIIALGLIYYAYIGYRHGFISGLLELLGIVVSVGLSFLLYLPASRVLERLGVSAAYAPAIAFLIVWFVTLSLYFIIIGRVYRGVPREVRASRANAVLGILPGLAKGLIVLAVALAVLTALPVGLIDQNTVEGSLAAPPLVNTAMAASAYAADIFGEAVQSALGFLTVRPAETEAVDLRFRVDDPVVDPDAEQQMLDLVNRERTQRGLRPLTMDPTIREVARRHSTDMFRRGYFGHVTPDGVSPFQRMRRGGVSFAIAGENVALAPTVRVAHNGLMQSPGHRENILRPQFRRIGIGAVRGGRYGIMFTQNFAD